MAVDPPPSEEPPAELGPPAERLRALAAAFGAVHTEDALVRVVRERAVPAVGAADGVLLLTSADGLALASPGAYGYGPALAGWLPRIRLDEASPAADAARDGRPVYLEDREATVRAYPAMARSYRMTGPLAVHTHATAVLPLADGAGAVLGTLGFSFSAPRAFDAETRALLEAVARQCAQALERARPDEAERTAADPGRAAPEVRDAEVRYRVTVRVEADGATHTGASVWSWRLSKPAAALASPYDGRFRGEAVAVDLGRGRTLFAILRGRDEDQGMAQMLPERVFGDLGRRIRRERTLFGGDRVRDLHDIASRVGERRTLDCDQRATGCPMLVRFRDLDDPATVERADPAALDQAFGPGVGRIDITVELTTDAVTRGIVERLRWLPGHVGALLKRPAHVAIGAMPLAGRLTADDFVRHDAE